MSNFICIGSTFIRRSDVIAVNVLVKDNIYEIHTAEAIIRKDLDEKTNVIQQCEQLLENEENNDYIRFMNTWIQVGVLSYIAYDNVNTNENSKIYTVRIKKAKDLETFSVLVYPEEKEYHVTPSLVMREFYERNKDKEFDE